MDKAMNNEYENTKQDLEEDRTVNKSNFHSKRTADVVNAGEISPAADSQKKTNADDWAVNTMVNTGNIANPSDSSNSSNLTTNAPNTNPLSEKNQDKWQMPEPIFHVSSGKKVEKPASATPRSSLSKPPETTETTNSVINIQPQPYISEALIGGDEFVFGEPPVEVKSRAGKTVFIAAGILAMILFAVGFLIGIYFLVFHI